MQQSWVKWMSATIIVMSLALPLAQSVATTSGDPNWISALRRELFENRKYSEFVRPVAHHSNLTEVYMQYSLTELRINELENTLVTHGWLAIAWTDDMLTWNPADFGNLMSIKLPSSQIWKPDIVVYNSFHGLETMPGTHVVLLHTGVVYYIPPLALKTHCDLDLTNWPFDRHSCLLRFGAWSHDSTEIILGIMGNKTEADLSHYVTGSSPWNVVSATALVNSLQFDCCSPPYQDAAFNFVIQRQSPFDAKMVMAPSIVIWSLVLFTFWMNPRCRERIHVGCTAIALVTILLMYFRVTLPAAGNHVPVIVIFHVTLLALSGLSVMVTLINSHLVRRDDPLPAGLLCCLDGSKGGPWDSERGGLRAQEEAQSETESTSTATTTMGKSSHLSSHHGPLSQLNATSRHWSRVAQFIDRLAFSVYLFIMLIILVRYLFL